MKTKGTIVKMERKYKQDRTYTLVLTVEVSYQDHTYNMKEGTVYLEHD